MNSLNYKNTPIAYSDYGKGTAVVLLHGFLENQKMWDNYLSPFTKNHRVITIDLLGHGDTACMGYVHTMEENAHIVQAVLSSLRIRKAIFVGHSMGGYVALAFAELYPDFLKGLVLLNSTAKADSEERKQNRDRAIVAVKQNHLSFVSLAVSNLFSDKSRAPLLEAIEKTKAEALKTPLQSIVASLEGMKIRDDREVLLHLTPYPKMLILGKKDAVLDYESTKIQIENTDVTLVSLPDGHMSHLENQEELTAILLRFFKQI